MRRLATLTALVVWLLAALVAPAAAAPTASTPAPASCAGVWVVVGSQQRCATAYGTGDQALDSAGFDVTRSGGLVCRIDGRPDRCELKMDAYWSYWHAERKPDGSYGAWAYSNDGSATYRPRYGDAEGWSFGDGKTPPPALPASGSIVPSAAPASPTAPTASAPAGTTAAPAASPTTASPAAPAAGGNATGALVTGGIVLLGAIALVVVLARRRRAR